jgi:2-haloacid dehalogenase
MPVDAIAFDAFGTLFDLEGLRPGLRSEYGLADGDATLDGFVARLVPWMWHSSASDRFQHLPEVAAAAFNASAGAAGIMLEDGDAEEFASRLRSLPAFPDVAEGLDALARWPLAILSNGTRDGVEALVGAADLSDRFTFLLAADQAGRYKPSPELYALAPRAFRTRKDRVLLVSSNEWDVAGAGQFGMRTAWLARGRAPSWVLGCEADYVVDALPDLAAMLV